LQTCSLLQGVDQDTDHLEGICGPFVARDAIGIAGRHCGIGHLDPLPSIVLVGAYRPAFRGRSPTDRHWIISISIRRKTKVLAARSIQDWCLMARESPSVDSSVNLIVVKRMICAQATNSATLEKKVHSDWRIIPGKPNDPLRPPPRNSSPHPIASHFRGWSIPSDSPDNRKSFSHKLRRIPARQIRI
jgi:hypothetical protein